jgi:hypothetical protein
MTMAVVNGYYSKLLSPSELETRSLNSMRERILEYQTSGKVKTFVTDFVDEYTPAKTTKQSSEAYTRPISSQNNYSQVNYSQNGSLEHLTPEHLAARESSYKNYLFKYNLLNVDLSACDLASDEYSLKHIEINGGKTAIDMRLINGEPKIYSLDEIYKATNPDTGILFKVVKPSAGATVPKEVKELGDWYVKHWNEISLSYVSNEGKIVSTEDNDLTREEEMKLYALKSAVLFKQLKANENANIKEENYYIREPFTMSNKIKIANLSLL